MAKYPFFFDITVRGDLLRNYAKESAHLFFPSLNLPMSDRGPREEEDSINFHEGFMMIHWQFGDWRKHIITKISVYKNNWKSLIRF
jgi:hypothetical protein